MIKAYIDCVVNYEPDMKINERLDVRVKLRISYFDYVQTRPTSI